MSESPAEWRWVKRYAEQFEACNLQPGEVTVLLYEASSSPQIVETARMALEMAIGRLQQEMGPDFRRDERSCLIFPRGTYPRRFGLAGL